MRVQLYVYDLSNGLARQISAAVMGTQIDAVYHTSIVMEGLEYVYDGGIRTAKPGETHLGPPREILELGITNLPMDVIMEYLESLREIYTAEAYDVWSHNCNNFSNDFSTFLIGQGIPEHIVNLPQTVVNTPLGRVLQPQINELVQRIRNQNKNGERGGTNDKTGTPQAEEQRAFSVRDVWSVAALNKLLKEAEKSCAVIFFTSKSCGPCKPLYPVYDQMAEEAVHKAILIKVDVSRAYDVGSKYNIRSTPTFMTFLRGKEDYRWSGSDPSELKGNVNMLIQSAWPSHPHESLRLPAFRSANMKPVLFSKLPPLEKLKAKMGPSAQDAGIAGVLHFVAARADAGAAEVTLPDLDAFSRSLRTASSTLPPEIMFTIVDLVRVAMVDGRFSGYYAEEKQHTTIAPLISYVNTLEDCPYSLRLVTLQMACNLFTSPLYPTHILNCPTMTGPIVQLISTSLLDVKHHSVRVAAASLSFNIATANSKFRSEERLEALSEGDQIELGASLLEAIGAEEESAEAIKGFLLAFGYLVYCAPKDGELVDLLKSMDAQGTVQEKQKQFSNEALIKEIGDVLLGKGLA